MTQHPHPTTTRPIYEPADTPGMFRGWRDALVIVWWFAVCVGFWGSVVLGVYWWIGN